MTANICQKMRIALVQLAVSASKKSNLEHAQQMIRKAAREFDSNSKSKSLVVLPECFNSPYGTQYFNDYAEEIPGETSEMLARTAKEEGVYLVGGSIPERRDGKIYNTSTVFDPAGNMILKYSKTHLFDIDIPGKIRFQESEVLTGGEGMGMFEMSSGVKVGIGICYDIRFAELSMLMARSGCSVLVFPGAFNMTTGPAHWELIQRGRAVDNQVYVATCSPARDMEATYNAWGHSTVVSPWGKVVAKADEKESITYADVDLEFLAQVRTQVPIGTQRREDIYLLSRVKSTS